MFVRKPFLLIWPEGHELHGLEVRMRRVSIADTLTAMELSEDPDGESPEDWRGRLASMADLVAGHLIGWNLRDAVLDEGGMLEVNHDGEPATRPVPADVAGVRSLDVRTLRAIMVGWTQAVVGVSDPLSPPSGDGEPSPVLSIPMEDVSENP